MNLALPAWAADSLHVALQVSNYNGFQVSCFGMKDGWIGLNVSGGEAPYTYKWSNGSGEEDQFHLAAGYYKVDVTDQGGQIATLQVTLEQPLPMKLDVDVYEYPNGHNISCYECNNGNASVVVMGGAAPFTVGWSDGPVGANRYNLGPRDYKITVADANGCEGTNTTIYLRGPAPSNWGMAGNANTVPGTNYLGTADNQDLVLKSNGQEVLKLQADGNIRIWGSDTLTGVLYRDSTGVLKSGPFTTALSEIFTPYAPCTGGEGEGVPYWRVYGNDFEYLCDEDPLPWLGTLSNHNLAIRTNNVQRMVVTTSGKVGIGTNPPGGAIGDYRLYVENGIVCRDVLVKLGTWPDHVFQPNYSLMPLDELREYLRTNKHLPGIPSAAELEAKQGVEVGDMQTRMLKVMEEQSLYILLLEEKLTEVEQRIRALEASQR
ncbi:MAG: SprB repeat-containing protein [Flavobacteriales bacterium]|nr:SprB repeat-containing protein [Flavobacteriales bacterium]